MKIDNVIGRLRAAEWRIKELEGWIAFLKSTALRLQTPEQARYHAVERWAHARYAVNGQLVTREHPPGNRYSQIEHLAYMRYIRPGGEVLKQNLIKKRGEA